GPRRLRSELAGRAAREPGVQALAAEAFALRQLVLPVPHDPREQEIDLVDLRAPAGLLVIEVRVRILERRDHRRTRRQRPALETHEVEQGIAAARTLKVEEGDEVPAVGAPLEEEVREVQVVVGETPLDALERVATLRVVGDDGRVRLLIEG